MKEDSERRLHVLKEEMRIRQELSKAETHPHAPSNVASIKKTLSLHLKKYPLHYGSFQVASDPCFQCGAGLNRLRNPSYRVKKDIQGKKQRRMERFSLIREARAAAAKLPDGVEKKRVLKAADDFTVNIDGAEKAILSRDAYHYTDEKIKAEGAPTGYLRGSEHPRILARYGITRDMLEPPDSKFRAELYIPDPEVFGANAKPIIVFKGTDLTCMEDCKADVLQANGITSDYYKQAIELGRSLATKTGGKFEAAGHSLGGGMASAVGAVTGCLTTTFNAAGLHPNTVSQYCKRIPSDPVNVSGFVVEGEVVNSSQDAINELGHRMVRSATKSPLLLVTPGRLAQLFVGIGLSSVPTQAGSRRKLPAHVNFKTPSTIQRHSMNAVISSIEQEKKENMRTLRKSLLENRGITDGAGYVA
jgi:hypothetical protein